MILVWCDLGIDWMRGLWVWMCLVFGLDLWCFGGFVLYWLDCLSLVVTCLGGGVCGADGFPCSVVAGCLTV